MDTTQVETDLRDNPPAGYVYFCMVTPWQTRKVPRRVRQDTEVIWYDGLGRTVNVHGCILMPRDADRDGTCYLFRPNNSITGAR